MSVYFQVEEYHRPQDLAQAVDILSRFGNSARVIAGGTDILPLRPGVKKLDTVHHLVDISKLGLNYVKKEGDHICIGAATVINTIGVSPLFLSDPYGALSDAAGAHSTATIRNRATVGGNLCTASPCGDLALPLLVLDAILVAAGPEGERHIPIESFFKGVNYSALNKEEVLLEIRIPLCSQKTGASFLKLRLKNYRKLGEIDPVLNEEIRSNGMKECLEKGAASSDWQKKWRQKPIKGTRKRGIGLSIMLHGTGAGKALPDPAAATVMINADGSVNLVTAAADEGQGNRTVLAQIASETLGIEFEC